jgi:hypothetical protein
MYVCVCTYIYQYMYLCIHTLLWYPNVITQTQTSKLPQWFPTPPQSRDEKCFWRWGIEFMHVCLLVCIYVIIINNQYIGVRAWKAHKCADNLWTYPYTYVCIFVRWIHTHILKYLRTYSCICAYIHTFIPWNEQPLSRNVYRVDWYSNSHAVELHSSLLQPH